jgi:hypothetical protein
MKMKVCKVFQHTHKFMLKKLQRKKRIKLAKAKPRVRIGSVWRKQTMVILLAFLATLYLSYRLFDGGNSVNYLLKINELSESKTDLSQELDALRLQIQLKDVAISKMDEELKKLKEENNDLQEDILFYEKIVGKRR